MPPLALPRRAYVFPRPAWRSNPRLDSNSDHRKKHWTPFQNPSSPGNLAYQFPIFSAVRSPNPGYWDSTLKPREYMRKALLRDPSPRSIPGLSRPLPQGEKVRLQRTPGLGAYSAPSSPLTTGSLSGFTLPASFSFPLVPLGLTALGGAETISNTG